MQNCKLIFCLSLLYIGNTVASPADYVYTPSVEQGEREIDFKFGTAKQADGNRATATSLGLGYGATEYWFTELYLKRESTGNEGVTLAEWENKFQLTETGKYPVDVGLITEIEAPINNGKEPWEFKFGPLFQTEFGKLQLNGNVLFERKFGPKNVSDADTDASHVTEMGYQWQVKYRLQPSFEFGLQGLGEVGKWNNWDNSSIQNHRMGPAIFGKLNVAQHQVIKYNAAMLFGVSDAAPDHTFRMQVEYEF